MKTLLNTLFYFLNPDIKLKNKIAAGWLVLIVGTILGGGMVLFVESVYDDYGFTGLVSIAAWAAGTLFTAWALITWLNEG